MRYGEWFGVVKIAVRVFGDHGSDLSDHKFVARGRRFVPGGRLSLPRLRGVICSDARSRLLPHNCWAMPPLRAVATGHDSGQPISADCRRLAASAINSFSISRFAGTSSTSMPADAQPLTIGVPKETAAPEEPLRFDRCRTT